MSWTYIPTCNPSSCSGLFRCICFLYWVYVSFSRICSYGCSMSSIRIQKLWEVITSIPGIRWMIITLVYISVLHTFPEMLTTTNWKMFFLLVTYGAFGFALRCSTTEPQRLFGERGLLRSSNDTRPAYCKDQSKSKEQSPTLVTRRKNIFLNSSPSSKLTISTFLSKTRNCLTIKSFLSGWSYFYFLDLNVWFRGDDVRRHNMLVTLREQKIYRMRKMMNFKWSKEIKLR